MSGSSEAGTFVNDIPDYEQGLDFDACDWLDDAGNEHAIGGDWELAMKQHRLSATGHRHGASDTSNCRSDGSCDFDNTITYKDVNVFTKSQALMRELQLRKSKSTAASAPERPASSWSGFSMLDSIYLPKSVRPKGSKLLKYFGCTCQAFLHAAQRSF
jgi:hypothetical protein